MPIRASRLVAIGMPETPASSPLAALPSGGGLVTAPRIEGPVRWLQCLVSGHPELERRAVA